MAFLTAQAQKKVGPPLADSVTKFITCYRRFVNGLFDDRSHGAEIVKKMRDVLISDNVPDLKTCKVNDCIFKSRPSAIKKESAKMQVVESALCKGIKGKVMELLMGLKKEISASANAKVNKKLQLLNDSSIEFSVFARSRVNDSRRTAFPQTSTVLTDTSMLQQNRQMVCCLRERWKQPQSRLKPPTDWLEN